MIEVVLVEDLSAHLGHPVAHGQLVGCLVDELPDGLVIQPGGADWRARPAFAFDCDQDHRLAMAARIACLAGAQIQMCGEEALSKSFPEFAQILRVAGSNA